MNISVSGLTCDGDDSRSVNEGKKVIGKHRIIVYPNLSIPIAI